MRHVSVEGGPWGENFDQREEFPDVPPIVVQAMLVAAGRRRRLKLPAGTPEKPRLTQVRQSRITMALIESDQKFAYRPAKSDYPDVGVRFDRKNVAESLAGRGLDSHPKLATAQGQKTTTSLSGLEPLLPTHQLFNLKEPFGTVAAALAAGPSKFKLATLTNADGGLGFPASRQRYQELLAQRQAAAAAAAAAPAADLQPEIPWMTQPAGLVGDAAAEPR